MKRMIACCLMGCIGLPVVVLNSGNYRWPTVSKTKCAKRRDNGTLEVVARTEFEDTDIENLSMGLPLIIEVYSGIILKRESGK